MHRGISIESIAETTRVSADLWHGLEQNNFTRWPSGLFARAYVRQYAEAIGVDPDSTVDEFCRWFAEGDRRAERIVREQAVIVGHDLQWTDDQVGVSLSADRRSGTPPPLDVPRLAQSRSGRAVAALVDAATVVAMGLAFAAVLPFGKTAAVCGCAILYPAISLVVLGCTPAVWLIDTHLVSRHPSVGVGKRRFVRLSRSAERAKA